jgi:hypothetical protein
MNYEDEIEEGAEVVRAFMVTEGRTVAMSEEFGLETMVSPTAHGLAKLHTMQFERRQILEDFDEPIAIAAIAAIAAVMKLPLRSMQIVASEMISDGLLQRHETIHQIETSVLMRIRNAIATP